MSQKYVLITAARNEELFIEKTINSIIKQKKLPYKWIIVSDGSTDLTDDIIKKYESDYDYIVFAKLDYTNDREFSNQANAINYGYEQLKKYDFDYIGLLDADIILKEDYYENILKKFSQNEMLGIAGGIIFEKNEDVFEKRILNSMHNEVSGAIQFFRRECFEKIGGYSILKYGGFDTAANYMVKMHGWDVETYTNLEVYHQRHTNSYETNKLIRHYKLGMRDYFVGYHPLYEVVKCIRRIFYEPIFLGSLYTFYGFFRAWFGKEKIQLDPKLISYVRKEQLKRLVKIP